MALRRPRGGSSEPPEKGSSDEESEDPEGTNPEASRTARRRSREDRRKGSEKASGRKRPRVQIKAAAAGVRKRAAKTDVKDGARKVAGPLAAGGAEMLAIGREMLRIPAGLWMRAAERLGLGILAILRFLRPIALAALAYARRAIDFLAREITPARAIAAVALAASILLAVTQFLDYRDVRAGVSAYADVELVAPPPTVDGSTETAGSAHLFVLLAAAIAAGVIVVLSMLGRWRLARLLFPIGLAAVAVAVFIDAPAGLDEGEFAIQFQGAEARLLGVFWVEVAAAAVIACCGPLLAVALRPNRARRAAAAKAPRRKRRLNLGRGRVQGARP